MRLRQFEHQDPDKHLARRDRWFLDLDFVKARMRSGKLRSALVTGLPGETYTGGAGFKLSQTPGGLWVPAAANDPGETSAGYASYDARTNSIRNPTFLGLVPGTPGTLPTNYSVGGGGGSVNAAGVGVLADGRPYADLDLVFTAVSPIDLNLETATGAPAATGQTWTAHASAQVISGTAASFDLRGIQRDSGGAVVGVSFSISSFATPGAIMRDLRGATALAGGATVAALQPLLRVNPSATGTIRVRIVAPNLKLGADIGDPPILQISNLAATRTADFLTCLVPPMPQGTMMAKWVASAAVGTLGVASLSDGTLNNFIEIWQATQHFDGAILSGGVQQWRVNQQVVAAGALVASVFSWSPSGAVFATSGGNLQQFTAGLSIPVISKLAIGVRAIGNAPIDSVVQRVRLSSQPVSPAEAAGMVAL